jgi:hypothetical protein
MRGLLDGGVTEGGEAWVRSDQAVGGAFRIEGGLVEATIATHLVQVPFEGAEVADSILLGTSSLLTADLPRRQGSGKVQYTNERLVAFDPCGAVWTAESSRYEIARLNSAGDTTLVINVELPALEIPEEVRRVEIGTLEEWFASVNANVPALGEAVPTTYPLIDKLAVDPQGRIWVQRRGGSGTVFECFTADGRLAGRYHIGVSPWVYGQLAVGDGLLVVTVVDSLDVQSLLVWALPQ